MSAIKLHSCSKPSRFSTPETPPSHSDSDTTDDQPPGGGVDTIPKLYPREIAMEISPFWWANHRTSKLLGHLAIALWDGSKPSITYILTTFGGTIIHEFTNFGVPSGYHPGTRALTHSHITRSLSLVNSSGELAQPTQSSSLRSSPMHKTNSTSPNICETCPDLAELGQTRHKADK